jgi:hypothetical protein
MLRRWCPRAPLPPATPSTSPPPQVSLRRRAPLRAQLHRRKVPPAARVAPQTAVAQPAAARRNQPLAAVGNRGAVPRVAVAALAAKGPGACRKAARHHHLQVAPRRPPAPSAPLSTKSRASWNTPSTAFLATPSASPLQLPLPLCELRLRRVAACPGSLTNTSAVRVATTSALRAQVCPKALALGRAEMATAALSRARKKTPVADRGPEDRKGLEAPIRRRVRSQTP